MSRALRTILICGSGCVSWRPRGGGLAIGGSAISWREEGLKLRRRGGRRRALGTRAPNGAASRAEPALVPNTSLSGAKVARELT